MNGLQDGSASGPLLLVAIVWYPTGLRNKHFPAGHRSCCLGIMLMLWVQKEISRSQSMSGNVHTGTPQQGDGPTNIQIKALVSLFFGPDFSAVRTPLQKTLADIRKAASTAR